MEPSFKSSLEVGTVFTSSSEEIKIVKFFFEGIISRVSMNKHKVLIVV